MKRSRLVTPIGFVCGALVASALAVAQTVHPVNPVPFDPKEKCSASSYCGLVWCLEDQCQCCSLQGGGHLCQFGSCNP